MGQREEEKREHPEGTIVQMVTCPFCGQAQIREGVATELSEEELEEFAKLHCDCNGAKLYQRKESKMGKAKAQILNWFGGEESEFTKKAMEIVQMVIHYQMDSATLVDRFGTKLKVSLSGKGNLKIGVSRTRTDTKEIS